jgi:hypothetical protein
MLMTAQVTMPTPRLMLILLLAPCVLLFAILLIMVATGIPSAWAGVLLGTFSWSWACSSPSSAAGSREPHAQEDAGSVSDRA